jgi:hypothetical protein
VAVLVIDDLIAPAAGRPGRPELGEFLSVGDLLARVLAPPLGDPVRNVRIRIPRMNDSPAASTAFWFASEIMPASATTVTSGSWWAVMKDSMTGSIVLVSDMSPSKALIVSGNPDWSVSSPMVICGSSRRSFENPLSRNPSPSPTSKYRVDTS